MFSYSNPFAGEQRLHHKVQDQWQAQFLNQVNLFEDVSNHALHGAQRMLDLSLNTGRAQLQKAHDLTQKLIQSKQPQDVLLKSLDHLQPEWQALLNYGAKMGQIASETGNEVMKAASKHAGKFETGLLQVAQEAGRKFEKAVVKAVDEAVEALEDSVEDAVENVERAAAKVARQVKKAADSNPVLKAAAQHFPAHLPEAPSIKPAAAKPAKAKAPKAAKPAKLEPQAVTPAKAGKAAKPAKKAAAPASAPVESAAPPAVAVNSQITDATVSAVVENLENAATPETLQE
ncbi:phasin family protein [Massilia sp. W12]|uniref:phasin family protein n=1 Tax=Massilia sp. W12 TaxID=3126507 RepID=UPI0030CDE9CF